MSQSAMGVRLANLTLPLLRGLPAEQAHDLTIKGLELGLYPHDSGPEDPRLSRKVMGLTFPNPVGVAAGFDKDARVPDAILGLGCGFAEVGTITPLPQSGNPKPRVFRLMSDRAIINRLGFNNGGHEAALERLEYRSGRGGIVGVNIGANKDASDRAADYANGIKTFYAVASYFTVNISSPNTPGLRDLQAPEALASLLDGVLEARAVCERTEPGFPRRPIVVKLAPDIAEDDLPAILDVLMTKDVDAMAVSNTTLSRPDLSSTSQKQGGGLSGRPLFHRSTVLLARVYRLTGGAVPLIGIGGIDSPERAVEKLRAGASLIQLYTGLVYEGPGLIARIKAGIVDAIAASGSLQDLTGSHCAQWADRPLEAA